VLPAALLLVLACQPPGDSQTAALETDEQKTAYTLGFKLGENLRPLQLPPDEVAAVQRGLADAASGGSAQVEIQTWEPRVAELANKRAAAVAEERRGEEEAYLAEAAQDEGAETFDSGLIMVTTQEGSGEMPEATSQVKVHYHGTFSDGTVFDSSVQRGEPAVFPLNRVIPCWTEALQKIKEGGKAKITCPARIAYGAQGAPPRIPPGATLVFEVELIEILDQPTG
jgi:FKBP-type peptidyl-prolyl cis-trans isomerase FkpA/FKBP-type peptidyl-prolyl cis-trans isomerase FklB